MSHKWAEPTLYSLSCKADSSGHKAKNTMPSIAWRREAKIKAGVDDRVSGKDDRDGAIVHKRVNMEPVSTATLGTLLRYGIRR